MECVCVCVGLCVWIHADDNNTHCSHYELNRLTLVTCVCGFVYECVLVLICTIHIFCIWSQLKRVNSKRNQIVYLRIRYNPCSHIESKIWYVKIHWCFSLMKQGFTTLFSPINAIMVILHNSIISCPYQCIFDVNSYQTIKSVWSGALRIEKKQQRTKVATIETKWEKKTTSMKYTGTCLKK